MNKNQTAPWPEILMSSKKRAQKIYEAVAKGEIRRLGLKLYTPNSVDDDETIIRRNLWPIVGLLAPGAVVSCRTALEGKPSQNNTVYLVGPARYERKLPGLNIKVQKGAGPQPGDLPFIGSLYLASRPRALLDALRPSRQRAGDRRGLLPEEMDTILEREFEAGGEQRLNAIRDQARVLVPVLDALSEFQQLDQRIGTLLGSRPGLVNLDTTEARLAGNPYDSRRFELFQKLFEHLITHPAKTRAASDESPAWENVSFFDAYFSNFIEGTEFEVEEAREIVFENKIPLSRPDDAHDVLGTYAVVGNRTTMSQTVLGDSNARSFIDRLRQTHATILESRTENRPGQFKTKPNRAGETHFVEPHHVSGTLVKAFEIARAISDPFNRAAAVMFFIAEIHPFDDGNGRVARALMNAELVAAGQTRIIIPSVFRDEYLTGLRVFTRQHRPEPFLEVLDVAQRYVSEMDWSNYARAEAQLRATNAFEQPRPDVRLRR